MRAGETRKAFLDSKNTLPAVFTHWVSFFKTSKKGQIECFMRVMPAEKGSSSLKNYPTITNSPSVCGARSRHIRRVRIVNGASAGTSKSINSTGGRLCPC